jgi:prepilin-type N-terminal cleavage/methylation domain-containing protein
MTTSFNGQNIIKGYSLIEFLVVIMIVTILFGVGMANYRNSSRTQALDRATEQLKADLRLAREYASSGRKPSGCDQLQGIGVTRQGGTRYQIEAFCIIGSNLWQDCHQILRPTLCLKPDIDFPSTDISFTFVPLTHLTDPKNFTVIFYVLGRGSNASTTSSNQIVLRLTESATLQTRDIVVTPDGLIN